MLPSQGMYCRKFIEPPSRVLQQDGGPPDINGNFYFWKLGGWKGQLEALIVGGQAVGNPPPPKAICWLSFAEITEHRLKIPKTATAMRSFINFLLAVIIIEMMTFINGNFKEREIVISCPQGYLLCEIRTTASSGLLANTEICVLRKFFLTPETSFTRLWRFQSTPQKW
jgi:hypothetical protein